MDSKKHFPQKLQECVQHILIPTLFRSVQNRRATSGVSTDGGIRIVISHFFLELGI